MIYTEMYGRLGNQFFRYAVSRMLQVKYYPEESLCFNFQQVYDMNAKDSTFYNVLDDFNVTNYSIYLNEGKVLLKESNFKQKLLCAVYYLGMKNILPHQMNKQVKYEEKWHKILEKNGIYWFRRGSWNVEKSNLINKFVSGNFESPIYFDEIRNLLLDEFTPKHDVLEKNIPLYNAIYNTNSICVSIRRGDFENNSKIKKLHSVCDKNYFENAINLMKKNIDNPVFFIFSDDIDWAKNNIITDADMYFEDGTDPVWEKLRMMYSCKHFIISNSTFSWWAQYLSRNNEKIVVSPDRWFNNDYLSPLISSDWLTVN